MEVNTNHMEYLQWYINIGINEFIEDNSIDRTMLTESTSSPTVSSLTGNASESLIKKADSKVTIPSTGTIEALKNAKDIAEQINTLDELKEALEKFDGLSLSRTASQIIFAEGISSSKVMLIGDTPGANEDRAGRAFIGASGQLLDKMLNAIGLSREENIYLTYLINWYPPGNRLPTESEISLCMPFIQKHIELIKPEIIICLGDITAKTLMQTKQSITRIHGKWENYSSDNLEKPIPAVALFRPEYLIASPAQKGKAWADLLKIKSKIAELGFN